MADIAVVGAGLAGLWTALWIKELDPISEVVVVEQGVAAYGASGRSAGIVCGICQAGTRRTRRFETPES